MKQGCNPYRTNYKKTEELSEYNRICPGSYCGRSRYLDEADTILEVKVERCARCVEKRGELRAKPIKQRSGVYVFPERKVGG